MEKLVFHMHECFRGLIEHVLPLHASPTIGRRGPRRRRAGSGAMPRVYLRVWDAAF